MCILENPLLKIAFSEKANPIIFLRENQFCNIDDDDDDDDDESFLWYG